MSDEFRRTFPQYLHRPLQILWFELDEVIIFFACFSATMIYGRWLWLIWPVGQYAYSRTKRNNPRGFLKHVLYILGFVQMKGYPEYFQKEFHE